MATNLDFLLSIYEAAALVFIVLFVIFGLDDVIIDILAWSFGLRPGRSKALNRHELENKPQKRIAVIVAAWKEANVIGRMVRGNFANLLYREYDFFVGVYPNDHETVEAVNDLKTDIENVHIVVNSRPGPTSKGQMLNQVIQEVISRRNAFGQNLYEILLIHDCEDIIDPLALLAINAEMDQVDFVQVPVFSLPVKSTEVVAGTYMDEFAEVHTKDIRIRNRLTGTFPAAGVGMALRREIVVRQMAYRNGDLFNESSLTEDYELGISTKQLGGRSLFLFAHEILSNGEKRLIATREFFPKKIKASIRQKTRWTVGIAFQGWAHLGWQGDFWDRFFLYRDRKGPWSNLIVLTGYAVGAFGLAITALRPFSGPQDVLIWGFYLTSGLMLNRAYQRFFACGSVYGWSSAIASVPRTPVANFVNSMASIRAIKQYALSRWRGTQLRWAKTDHELPAHFGVAASSPARLK